ncbi:sensor histidine kinase [Parapedobacter sp. GCM10030251]|uniref:sensor histidine kinase n=1 Tax=Parapedobacter sp. GCM10030251 TaxID=3273419 RepID=UPI003607C42B
MNLNAKLTLYFTLSKLAIIAVFLLLLPYIFDWISLTSINNYLRQQENKVFATIEQNGMEPYLQDQASFGSYTMLKEEYISMEPVGPEVADIDQIADGLRLIEADTLNYRILSRTFSYDGQRYLLEIGRTTATIQQYNIAIRRIALYVLIGLVSVTIILDFFFSRIILKPLGQIIKTRLVGQRFPFKGHMQPIRTSTRDFRLLDESFIELMERVRQDFDREKEFTANASHELLTPISILKSKIENLMLSEGLDESVAAKLLEMMHTLSRLNSIVKSMLLIARIDNAQFHRGEAVRIDRIISGIREELAPQLETKNITFTNRITRLEAIPNLNKELMFHLFSNLIRNAIRYNKQGGHIDVYDSIGPDGYWIHIRDTGEGFPPSKQEEIFERFNRIHHHGGEGFGLGLSIVRSIAHFFSITIRVESSLGEGSVFSVGFRSD